MAEDALSGFGPSIGVTQRDTRRIYCVVSQDYENITDLQSQQLKKAFELLKKHKAKTAEASVNKVLSLKRKIAGFSYIIPEFSGALYEHLVRIGARIYGPLAIIQSLNSNGMIPKYPKPLLAMYCVNFNITVTGLNIEERIALCKKVEALGGITSGSLTPKTTHLFARTCDPESAKYQQAAKVKMPVVKPEWVDFAYESAKEGTNQTSDVLPMDDYMVQIFTGCTMTTSGFNGEQRLKISTLVQTNGGTFSASMAQQTCTHLIIDSNTGDKYRKAIEWGSVKIVTLQWLLKSTEYGIRLPEERYLPGIKTSTPQSNNRTLTDPSLSCIFPQTQHQRKPPRTATTASSNASIVAGDHAMMSFTRQKNATATAIITSQPLNISTSAKRNQSFASMDSSQVLAKVNDPIMDFDITRFEEGFDEYLQDCRLHFFQVSDEQRRVYRRLANCTGCQIADSVSAATHIIVPPGNYSTKQLNQLKEALESDIEVVRSEWLLECVQIQCAVDTETFIFQGLRENDENNDVGGAAKIQQRKRSLSIDREFEVPQAVLDEINPECELSSMHNTGSFEKRMNPLNAGDTDDADKENQQDKQMDLDKTMNDEDASNTVVRNDSNHVNLSNFDAFGDEPQLGAASNNDVENIQRSSNPTYNSDRLHLLNDDAENIPPSSNVANNPDGLNLSFPIENYLSGERPVKLHLPWDQLRAPFSGEDSEPDSPTMDPLKLKQTLATMAKNSCESDSEYIRAMGGNEAAMDRRDWREMSLYKQPVDHDFRSPLRRLLPPDFLPLRQHQEIAEENFEEEAAPVIENDEPELTNVAQNVEPLNTDGDVQIEEAVPVQKDGEEVGREETVTSTPPLPVKKQKSFEAFLSPELLKRCEAVANHSTSFPNNGPAVTPAAKRLSDFNEHMNFDNDKEASQRDLSPAKVVWEGQYSIQDLEKLDAKSKEINFIPSTQQLQPDDNFFDADSADPFQRLSNQNIIAKVKPKNVVKGKKASQTKKHIDEVVQATAENEENGVKESEVVLNIQAEDNGMGVAESIITVEAKRDEAKNVSQKKKNNPVYQPPVVITVDDNNDDGNDVEGNESAREKDNTFDEAWPECGLSQEPPPSQSKVKTVKPSQRRRMFGGLEDESVEENTEESDQSIKILAGVKPKHRKSVTPAVQQPTRVSQRLKRRAEEAGTSMSPVASEPSSKRGKRGSNISTLAAPVVATDAPGPSHPPTTSTVAQPPKNVPIPNNPSQPPTYSNNYQVIFTNFLDPERRKLQELVATIKGTNLDETTDIQTAEVVVSGKLNRSEKLMIALAAGKYIVSPAFITESCRNGVWLPREDFEYGNPKSARRRVDYSNAKDPVIAEKIFHSCYRLRYKTESLGTKAFHNWKVLIFAQSSNAQSLIRIIEYGGGEAEISSEVTHKEYKDFSLAIILPKNPGLFSETDRQILNQLNIPYYTDQVLSNYLLSTDTEDALKKSWHLQYRQFMQQQKKR